MRKRVFWLTASVVLLSFGACKQTPEQMSMNYFFGDFVYYVDAAVFYDCVTGRQFPVSHDGVYLQTEKRYLSMNPEPGERIMVDFRGRIVEQPSAEEGQGMVSTIVIDTLLGFNRTMSCNPEFVLSGLYESTTDGIRQVLTLRTDYTYQLSHFLSDGKESSTTGKWGLASELELVLRPQTGANIEPLVFQVIPDKHALSANGANKPLVYNKVFLK